MRIFSILITALLFLNCTHSKKNDVSPRVPQSDLNQRKLILEPLKYANRVTLRTGVFLEAENQPLKACVVYLPGLGDSIRNHDPLFRALSDSGYRVITYDYMGQGGSGGLMNDTRLSGQSYKQIGMQARWLWDYRSKVADPTTSRSCQNSKKLVIGWSTGGLAAYRLAFEKWADAVVLIAPGIHPKFVVGEAAVDKTKAFHTITQRTLTRNKFENSANPHLDPIKPETPLRSPLFAGSLLITAKRSQSWEIDSAIKGLVFLSGDEDSYVYRDKTIQTLNKNARQFEVVAYDGALHELDNELPDVAQDLQRKTVEFFDRAVLN